MKRILIVLIIALLAAIPAAEAKSAHPKKSEAAQRIPVLKPIVATYDVYVGGVHFLTADILFQEEKGAYHTRMKAKTYGFWYKLLPWNSTLDANGKIADDRFVPAVYSTLDVFKDKPKATKLMFDAKGDITPEFDPPSHDEDREQVTQEQRRGSLDPASALLQMLANTAMAKSCAMNVPVFDGKRRFDITGSDNGTDTIDEKDYSAYRGPARLCSADFTMIAGNWKNGEKARFWEKNDKEVGREPFSIWLAKISPELPEMAVRLESGSVWGLIVAHLTQWRYAGPDDLKS